MKTILSFVAVAFFVSNLMGMEDGLYDISDSAHPRLIDDLVGQARIISQLNDNTGYVLALKARDDFPLPVDKIELVISNQKAPFTGWNWGMRLTDLDFALTNADVVPQIAKHYHTKAIVRHHPGYQMLVQFIPDKAEFSTNEPITVKLRITNVGKKNFAYVQYGNQNGAWDGQFAFTAEQLGGKKQLEVGVPLSLGNSSVVVSLKPGESHELVVDLTKCFNFTAVGNYAIRGSYAMQFCDPILKNTQPIWDDFATAEFGFRIKK